MSRLLLARHGKAADQWSNYDRLSSKGFQQAALLGQRLARDEPEIAALVHGVMRRQRETAETARAELVNAGRAVPALGVLPTLDEIAPGVVDAALASEPDPALRAHVASWATGDSKGDRATFQWLMRSFARFEAGEISGDFETWPEFRARVQAALAALVDPAGGTTVAFTSGGFIATAVGIAVRSALPSTLSLMATLENASLTELRWSRSREELRLVRLNDLGHLPPEARTLI